MLDELRAIDWVPRSVRAKARTLEQTVAELQATLHRTPTDAELADELGVTEAELQTTLGQVSFTGLVALDDLLARGDRDGGTTLGRHAARRRARPAGRLRGRPRPTNA